MDMPQIPEPTPEYLEARESMKHDAETIVAMVRKELANRAGFYSEEDNPHFEDAEEFLAEFVREKLANIEK